MNENFIGFKPPILFYVLFCIPKLNYIYTKSIMTQAIEKFFENRTRVLLALVLPAVFVYLKTLKFGFTTMDEQWMIVQSASFLEKWENIKTIFIQPIAQVYYRPLFSLSLFIDYHLGKLSPGMYHFTNLAWHLFSVILLYRFLLLSKADKKTAFVFASLFSMHPLLLHAVAWIPGRNDTMLCAFTLLSFIYLYRSTVEPGKRSISLHFLFFLCALLTKENAVILPLVYLLLLYSYTGNLKKLFFPASIWTLVIVAWLFCRNAVVNHPNNIDNGFGAVAGNFIHAFLNYAGKAFFPFQQSVYPALNTLAWVPGLFAVLLLTALCFRPGLKNGILAIAGLCIFFFTLALPIFFSVTSGGDQQYEHRAYTALAGLALFFTQVNFKTNQNRFLFIPGVIFLFFIVRTNSRMNVYRNELSFVEAGTKECPDYYLFHLQKGDLYNHRKDFNAAIDCYDQSISIRPGYGKLYSNRGIAYLSLGRCHEAISDYNTAIRLSSFDKHNYLNRSMAYAKCNDIENAMKDLSVVKKCCAEIIPPDIERDIAGKWAGLVENLIRQSVAEPKNAKPYYKMACMFFDIDMKEEGMENLKTAIRLDPSNAEYALLMRKHSSS
jgi:tetratricopeptide (TPR) repeat protein